MRRTSFSLTNTTIPHHQHSSFTTNMTVGKSFLTKIEMEFRFLMSSSVTRVKWVVVISKGGGAAPASGSVLEMGQGSSLSPWSRSSLHDRSEFSGYHTETGQAWRPFDVKATQIEFRHKSGARVFWLTPPFDWSLSINMVTGQACRFFWSWCHTKSRSLVVFYETNLISLSLTKVFIIINTAVFWLTWQSDRVPRLN